jgi:hypothetical protein
VPQPLLLAYEGVMLECGFTMSHLNSMMKGRAQAYVLILDDSYVVAEQFTASPV